MDSQKAKSKFKYEVFFFAFRIVGYDGRIADLVCEVLHGLRMRGERLA